MEAVETDPGAVILDEIARLEGERGRIEAAIASRMLEFSDLRRRQSELALDSDIGRLEASFAADELSLVLLQAPMTVQCRLAAARRVRGLLPVAWNAFVRGVLDQQRMRLVGEAVDKLESNHSIIELDDRVVAYASSHTVSQLRAWLNRFVASAEPDSGEERAKEAAERRAVYVEPGEDGMSWIHAFINTVDATRIDSLLTGMGKNKPVDGVTLEQRRADLFADLLLGRVDGLGNRTGTSRGGAVIGVTVPITSLAGWDEAPGEAFDHSFTLPASLVRELAAEPGTLFYRLLTDPAGYILDATELGRFPSDKLQIALDIRDGTCAFPTCSVPAMNADADHDEPIPRGPTTGRNLKKLCRRHHRMKTFGIVGTSMVDGQHRWHLPTGRTIPSETYSLGPAQPKRSRNEIDFATFVIQARHVA